MFSAPPLMLLHIHEGDMQISQTGLKILNKCKYAVSQVLNAQLVDDIQDPKSTH